MIAKKQNRRSTTSSRTVPSGSNRDTSYDRRISQLPTSCGERRKTCTTPPGNVWTEGLSTADRPQKKEVLCWHNLLSAARSKTDRMYLSERKYRLRLLKRTLLIFAANKGYWNLFLSMDVCRLSARPFQHKLSICFLVCLICLCLLVSRMCTHPALLLHENCIKPM